MSRPYSLDFTNHPSLTKQSFQDETNINNIMAKWKRTGVIDHLARNPPTYGDFETVDEYQEAQNKVIAAQAAFDALPAAIRDRMHNDPARFMAFMHDPANAAEARALGLLATPDPEPPPSPGPAPQGATASGVEPTPPSRASPNPSPISGGE